MHQTQEMRRFGAVKITDVSTAISPYLLRHNPIGKQNLIIVSLIWRQHFRGLVPTMLGANTN
jgi:hypothetical protein